MADRIGPDIPLRRGDRFWHRRRAGLLVLIAAVIAVALQLESAAFDSAPPRRLPAVPAESQTPQAAPGIQLNEAFVGPERNPPALMWLFADVPARPRHPDDGGIADRQVRPASTFASAEGDGPLPRPELLPPVPPPDRSGGAPESSGAGEISNAERLGREPENSSLAFLRRETVLLKPRQWQLDLGLTYAIDEAPVPLAVTNQAGDVAGVASGQVRLRQMTLPLEIRYGLLPRAQVFLQTPVGWSNAELSAAGTGQSSNVVGMGDIRAGTSILLKRGENQGPDIIGTFDMTCPTGNGAFPLVYRAPTAEFGEGFFALASGILFVQAYDPLVLFYGGGYRHRVTRSFSGTNVDPGEQFFYQLGLGFGVNERITLSSSFLGGYITQTYLDGRVVEGTIAEPMRLRVSATVVNPERELLSWRAVCKVREIVEPFVEIGLTAGAPAARLGVIWTY